MEKIEVKIDGITECVMVFRSYEWRSCYAQMTFCVDGPEKNSSRLKNELPRCARFIKELARLMIGAFARSISHVT